MACRAVALAKAGRARHSARRYCKLRDLDTIAAANPIYARITAAFGSRPSTLGLRLNFPLSANNRNLGGMPCRRPHLLSRPACGTDRRQFLYSDLVGFTRINFFVTGTRLANTVLAGRYSPTRQRATFNQQHRLLLGYVKELPLKASLPAQPYDNIVYKSRQTLRKRPKIVRIL